jgi:hypothetical protein
LKVQYDEPLSNFAYNFNSRHYDLAANITTEQGKTLADARGDVFRGLEARPLRLTSYVFVSSCPFAHSVLVYPYTLAASIYTGPYL